MDFRTGGPFAVFTVLYADERGEGSDGGIGLPILATFRTGQSLVEEEDRRKRWLGRDWIKWSLLFLVRLSLFLLIFLVVTDAGAEFGGDGFDDRGWSLDTCGECIVCVIGAALTL